MILETSLGCLIALLVFACAISQDKSARRLAYVSVGVMVVGLWFAQDDAPKRIGPIEDARVYTTHEMCAEVCGVGREIVQ